MVRRGVEVVVKIIRGDILWADLEPTLGHEQAGHRPVLVLSHEIFNQHAKVVIAAALTSQPQKAAFPLTFELNDVLPKQCWVKISQIRTLSVKRLGKKLGHLDHPTLEKIIEGLNKIIG